MKTSPGLLLLPFLLSAALVPSRSAVAMQARPARVPARVPAAVAVPWRGLSFEQDGLHNCGTVSMLMAWANLHPAQANQMVRRLRDGSFRVAFANVGYGAGYGAVAVSRADIDSARRVSLVRCARGDAWPLAVLTAFARLRSRTSRPDFAATEWIYAGEIARCLSRGPSQNFHIKPMAQSKIRGKLRIKVGAPIAIGALEAQMRRIQGRPTVAYNNRCVHIWAVLGYDARRKMVRARNPRRAQSVWMPLRQFRDQFQILVSGAA